MMDSWRRHRWRNRLQTLVLISTLMGITMLAGWLLLGVNGALVAVLTCILALLVQPTAASRLTLSLYRARPIGYGDDPALIQLVRQLARRAGLEATPALYYVPSTAVNAFAVGHRDNAAIALTDGLLRSLSGREVAAVLGHELAHIAHDDLRVMGMADVLSRLTSMAALLGQILLVLLLPWWLAGLVDLPVLGLALLILSPHLALLAQLALSRVREFDADLDAVRLTGDPRGLASALVKIEHTTRSWRSWLLPGWGNPQPSWLRTHPATEDRVRRLQALSQEQAYRSDLSGQWLRRPGPPPPRWFPGGGHWR
ncbi:MAG: zinc metalloprotease HtpX [Marinobacter sp.]|uniref:zinc metalloprotease HtpX n=1 Tax=Marinobacter sp. TaxID=50741 RepID=UPI00299DC6E0|nr:zinc metalloprotease HtpX [Marinobacter sp.]MDX1755932.1 zinc metalloprotease HtpX [Marinobacter sp.]